MPAPEPLREAEPQRVRRGRPRQVLRVHFHLDQFQDPDLLFEQLLLLVEDITPVHQPYPQDHSVDLDITGALRLFDRSPHELAQLLQLRAIALFGVRATVGGGPSRIRRVRRIQRGACGEPAGLSVLGTAAAASSLPARSLGALGD
ncbi:hypothetical protein [Streptomyces sp. NBC_01445]|uniref:hypothetical protein n=1 Tax=Streptomyces sp. NBC_01445 TaxID=2903869 RepID=UPI002DDB5A71|nr:hypothetical protein [Streptomyces sp. NBC_01445]WSE01968.1 hypothetical protein OG574_00085 [Streptomyces sp. NBC_01445]WSE10363.1 hypothetical protein OG574_47930 [Streptomyces sp. NBC_01445]WSE11071.1 hypothetical protein OG574_48095 [Streptomyces sp. NBC_01445]